VQWDTELTTAMGQQPAIVQETEPRPLQQTPFIDLGPVSKPLHPKLRSLDQRGKPALFGTAAMDETARWRRLSQGLSKLALKSCSGAQRSVPIH